MNCNTIFVLDLKEGNHKYLQHPLLKDTCAMELHQDRLITISSDGNAVVWDLKSYRVCLYFHIFDSPEVQCIGDANQGIIFEREPLIKDLEDPELLALSTGYKNMGGLVSTSLQHRETNSKIASLLVSYDGFVFAWSIDACGGVIAKFRAVTEKSAKITCMTTDTTENILLTGDSTGIICLWDIQGYADRKKSDPVPHERIKGWRTSLCAPPLLRSWQSGNDWIVSVLLCPDCDVIISAGLDQNVKIWNMKGDFLGTFMKDRWDPSVLMFPESKDRKEFKKVKKTDDGKRKILVEKDPLGPAKKELMHLIQLIKTDKHELDSLNSRSYLCEKNQTKTKPVARPPVSQRTTLPRTKTTFVKTERTPKTLEKTAGQSHIPILKDKKKLTETKSVAHPPVSQRTTLSRTKTTFVKTLEKTAGQSNIPILKDRKRLTETKPVACPPVSQRTLLRTKTPFVKTEGTPKTLEKTAGQSHIPTLKDEKKLKETKPVARPPVSQRTTLSRTKTTFVKTERTPKTLEKTAGQSHIPILKENKKLTETKPVARPPVSQRTLSRTKTAFVK
ncbi:uncharacterized protein LOC118598714, partial [Oryzias melastigma]|uniref:uncharacterized protein LOC118598714 n=1 Tax=Oryzias melastigma TaxID=30732 RepID=UPI00168CBC65